MFFLLYYHFSSYILTNVYREQGKNERISFFSLLLLLLVPFKEVKYIRTINGVNVYNFLEIVP